MKVVFLHGIGSGEPERQWLVGLNQGLAQAGFDSVRPELVIAPRYSSLLSTDGIAAKLPPITFRPKDDLRWRREFERQQARVQRLLKADRAARAFGFDRVPDAVFHALADVAVNALSILDLHQVRRYVRHDQLRGAVMRNILDHLPSRGDIVLIGHSLGSVIAIDLLDHLPENLHVRRFVTIGSPASMRTLHDGSERLLKRFPYGRVDDWSNFLDVRDVVTGGRGLAAVFPGAQDFVVDTGGNHGAECYLSNVAVARVIGEALFPRKDVAVASTDVAVRLDDQAAIALLLLHFGHAVANEIKDKERAARYRDALKLQQDDVAYALQAAAVGTGIVASEIADLAAGKLPILPHRWEADEVVGELVILALTNLVAPFEIDVDRAPLDALPNIAVELGFRREFGTKVGQAITEVQAAVGRKGGVPWGKVVTAAAGIALVAAGPVGLAVAAPATAYGAAAITGGLAAFGPGGMVGGLAMLGGLAGTGAAVTAGAVASGSGGGIGEQSPTKLIIRVASEYARKQLDLGFDESLWYQLADFETQLSAELNRLSAFSDKDSPKVRRLIEGRQVVARLMVFMIENGLTPRALEAGFVADKSSEAEIRALAASPVNDALEAKRP